jgi:hypothetical protein
VEGDVRRGNLRATEGDQLAAGDVLQTGPAGSGALLVGDEGRIELGAGTVLQIAVSSAPTSGTVRAGSALVDRVARTGGQPFGLSTAQARITTSGARFAVTAGARQTRVDAWSGAVSVRAPRGQSDVTVLAHQSALIDEGSDHVKVVDSDRPVLLIIGTVDKGGRLEADQIVRRRLEGAHLSVTVTADEDVTTTALRASALVVVSSSVDIGILGTQLRDLAVPIVVAEPWLLDDLGMTQAGNEDNQAAFSQQVVIVGNDHPLAAGLSGPVQVADTKSVIAWGRPNAVAATIATYKGTAERATIFGYEKGDAMPGLRAPARRVFLFMHDGTAAHLTSDGWALFDAAIQWAAASP